MPTLWGADHARRYEETDGQVGAGWDDEQAPPTLLLTTIGRQTGLERKVVLVYQRHGDGYVVVGSRDGQVNNPDWYHNVVAKSDVSVQIMADKFPAQARVVTAEPERTELWNKMLELYPGYDDIQARTERQIPVVLIEPQ
ncbi:nitroreductase family deazaflavin-dependent oxidoreductase [Nocardia sp. NPDC050175]|uniref:nitroreductase family deazaflavin-dependent oxidoreductase n=1 Tax=Nocardia sp. NPDC050175 TaxID=3364317 RepID=UPI003791C59C